MHEELKEQCLVALQKLFGDTSVNPATTLESLEEIQGEIETYIDAIKSDLGEE